MVTGSARGNVIPAASAAVVVSVGASVPAFSVGFASAVVVGASVVVSAGLPEQPIREPIRTSASVVARILLCLFLI